MVRYDNLLDKYIDVIKENKGLWNVVKDEETKSFAIFGPSLHDFDFMYLFSKLDKRSYNIQLAACPVSSESYNSIKEAFLSYGYTWEDPAEMMTRLIDKI